VSGHRTFPDNFRRAGNIHPNQGVIRVKMEKRKQFPKGGAIMNKYHIPVYLRIHTLWLAVPIICWFDGPELERIVSYLPF
jgi:hypothetical protein